MQQGKTVIIARAAGKPAAVLGRLRTAVPKRVRGVLKGHIKLGPEFCRRKCWRASKSAGETEFHRECPRPPTLCHAEAGGELLPIEVKSSARPRLANAAHFRTFRAQYGKKARAGLLLHTGSTMEWLASDVLAAPWSKVL